MNIQIPTHLQNRNGLDFICIDRNRSQVDFEWQFVKGKNGAERDTEDVIAVLATPLSTVAMK